MSSLHSNRQYQELKVKISSRSDRKVGRKRAQDNSKKTSTNNERNS